MKAHRSDLEKISSQNITEKALLGISREPNFSQDNCEQIQPPAVESVEQEFPHQPRNMANEGDPAVLVAQNWQAFAQALFAYLPEYCGLDQKNPETLLTEYGEYLTANNIHKVRRVTVVKKG